jgi:lipid-binding SYLF domain-containing protein
MKPMQARIASAVLVVLAASGFACSDTQKVVVNPTNQDHARAVDELDAATVVVREMGQTHEIALARRQSAKCVIVVPDMKSGAFLVGGSKGRGVATCRTARAWSAPAFVRLSGVSAGLQIGGQKQDLLMLVTTGSAMSKLLTSSFQLGGDMSVAAGPVGEGSQAAANAKGADVLTYARSSGLFAGVQLSGVWVKHDAEALSGLYGPANANIAKILDGGTPPPAEARPFLEQVAMVFPAAQ